MDKNKKATINPINQKKLSIHCNSCVKLCRNKKKDLQRITKIKPFINKYSWEGINFPSVKDDWKSFEKNNVKIAINILYAKKEKKILCLCFRTTQIVKKNYSSSDFKWR